MTTDSEWQAWGARDPYYAVLTNPKFRSAVLNEDTKQAFFDSGKATVEYVINTCRRYIDPGFNPQRILDFGCGVGRMSIPFATRAREVMGMDVAESMLAEARANCEAQGCRNLTLVRSDDRLSAAVGQFDLVHSCLVLQHVEIPRGRLLFEELVARVQPGGCGAIQITYAWDRYPETYGVVPPPPKSPNSHGLTGRMGAAARRIVAGLPRLGADPAPPAVSAADADPEMQMNYYNLSEMIFILQRAGVRRVFTELVNHGGAFGAFLFFGKEPSAG